jgi:hypothetical protein
MSVKPGRLGGRRPGGQRPSGGEAPTKPSVGRPKGEPSTIVNVRLPLTLVAQLDRYLDRLEWQTGLKANRGMITRRALELFLTLHPTEAGASEEE